MNDIEEPVWDEECNEEYWKQKEDEEYERYIQEQLDEQP